jgi:hypothetical protein
MITSTRFVVCCALVACRLDPRVPDDALTSTAILPAGSTVPSIGDNAELLAQIQLNDGLSDAALAASGGVVTRSTGKAAGAPVMYWNFGAVPIESGFAVAAPAYVLAHDNGDGTFTPLDTHPYLLDTICGDVRYSPIRRVIYVPVTSAYAGQLLPTMTALADARTLGLVGEAVPAGTWINLPVVLPGTKLEVSAGVTAPTKQVFARGYRVDVFELGTSLGQQPLRNGLVPTGQASSLLSGVATGVPPSLPVAPDAQPVFQFAIPAGPPMPNAPNYSPIAAEVDVRLATGVDPTMVMADGDLFKRNAAGAISGYYVDKVASFTVTTTVTDRQVQYVDGAP